VRREGAWISVGNLLIPVLADLLVFRLDRLSGNSRQQKSRVIIRGIKEY